VRAVANGVLTYDVQLDLSAEASFEQDGEKVLTKLSKPIFIPPSAAYPLPITGEVVLTVKVGFEAAAKARAELTAGFTSVHSASAGAEYADGMWSEILEFDHSADPVAPDFVGSAEAEGRVYVRPELAVNIYHVAGPFIGLEPGLAAFAEFSFMDEALFCSFVASGTLDALVGFDVRILDDDVDRFEKSFEGPEWFWSEFDCSDEGPTEPMLIAHYPLDGTGEDISGNGYDGTLVGATPAPDRFGDPLGALSFDGQGDYMTVPIPTQRYESFSICGWAAATGPNPAGSATRLLGGRVGGTRSLVAITYSLGDRATLVGEYGGAGSAGLRSFVDTGFNLFDGDWHHICMAAGPDDVVLYLDGREVGRDALRTSGPITTDIVLGAYTDNGLIEHGFVGRIDDLRLFDRPLSPEEVEAEWAPATE
jgi:hypothetical protein